MYHTEGEKEKGARQRKAKRGIEKKEKDRERERGGKSVRPPPQQNRNAGSLVKECGMGLKGRGIV